MRRVGVLAVLAAVFVTIAWWMFLISPRNGQIADYQDDLVVAQDTEQRLRVQIRQLQEIRDREVEYRAALAELEGLIPDRPLLDEFIEEIFALTNDSGVELLSLAPSLPTTIEEGEDLREIVISGQIEGQFFEILGFLFGLSEMDRLVRVDGIAMTSSEFEGQTLLSVGIEMRLFTLADLLPPLEDLALTNDEATTTTTTIDAEAAP